MNKSFVVGAVCMAGALLAWGFVHFRDGERPGEAARDEATPADAAPAPGESEHTLRLRGLLGKDPAQAVALARQGNLLYPSGSDAAERSWILVKSLTDLGKFDEARAEAREMVARHRGTRWADDVYRHVLQRPPGPPERGE
jgi:hypothetical protein